jgi:hypothetical protein
MLLLSVWWPLYFRLFQLKPRCCRNFWNIWCVTWRVRWTPPFLVDLVYRIWKVKVSDHVNFSNLASIIIRYFLQFKVLDNVGLEVRNVFHDMSKKIWKQSDPSEALITTKLHEIEKYRIPKKSPTRQNWKCCRLGLIESVHER